MPLSKSQNWKNKRFEHQEHNFKEGISSQAGYFPIVPGYF
jgi:hypothetical protein